MSTLQLFQTFSAEKRSATWLLDHVHGVHASCHIAGYQAKTSYVVLQSGPRLIIHTAP